MTLIEREVLIGSVELELLDTETRATAKIGDAFVHQTTAWVREGISEQCLKALLIISGIEPNPGPPAHKRKGQNSKSKTRPDSKPKSADTSSKPAVNCFPFNSKGGCKRTECPYVHKTAPPGVIAAMRKDIEARNEARDKSRDAAARSAPHAPKASAALSQASGGKSFREALTGQQSTTPDQQS